MGNRSLCANFQVCSSLRTDAIVFTTDGHTDGRTDRHSSNVLEFCADLMSPRNIGSQIIISMCYKLIYPLWGGYYKYILLIKIFIKKKSKIFSKRPFGLIHIYPYIFSEIHMYKNQFLYPPQRGYIDFVNTFVTPRNNDLSSLETFDQRKILRHLSYVCQPVRPSVRPSVVNTIASEHKELQTSKFAHRLLLPIRW